MRFLISEVPPWGHRLVLQISQPILGQNLASNPLVARCVERSVYVRKVCGGKARQTVSESAGSLSRANGAYFVVGHFVRGWSLMKKNLEVNAEEKED